MSNSALVEYVCLSPNHSGERTQPITKITPHHMSGNLSVETCGKVFLPPSRKASSNYSIDTPGRCAMYVPENFRAWTSSSAYNDQRAATIEVANSQCKEPWPISDAAWNKLVDLCVDIVQRNPGIVRADGKTPGLNYTGDKYGSLTTHKMFSNTDCPGTWLDNHMKELEAAVNAKLDSGVSMPKPVATAPTATAKPATAANSTNKRGSAWIRDLQTECNKQGFSNQKVDGIAGPNTLKGCPTLRKGAKGNITKLMQQRLISLGYSVGKYGADSSFGSGTLSGVKAFQKAMGLVVDGIVGKNTWCKLLGL